MPTSAQEVRAIAGQGLEGDPYVEQGLGGKPGTGQQLTLIAREEIEKFNADGHELSAGESRRQIETEGIDLNALVGKRFQVGEVEALGIRLCQPCIPLQTMTGLPVMKGLRDRGGLRADVVSSGLIQVGDEVVALD